MATTAPNELTLSAETMSRTRLYVLFDALEQDLRDLLREWVLPYKDVETVFGERLADCQQRAAAERASEVAPEELVDYLDFADGFGLLNRHEEMLPPEAATALGDHTHHLEQFVPVRN